MAIAFHQLNVGWNAEPNVPSARVELSGSTLVLEFTVNAMVYPSFAEDERVRLVFDGCSLFRLGPTNDEGWHLGQCRFTRLAPEWGEFYEVTGDTRDEEARGWQRAPGAGPRHFLFYLRDATFECKATNWRFETSRSRVERSA